MPVESARLDGVEAGHREKNLCSSFSLARLPPRLEPVRASRLLRSLFLSRVLKSGEAANSLLFISSESFHLANFSTI